MTAGVRLAGVRKRFGAFEALRGIDLAVEAGEFLTLLGPSGCGKSTTLNLVAGFIEPDAGTIEIGGADVSRLPPFKRNIGVVFQDYALFPHMNVERNVAYGLRSRGIPGAEMHKRVGEALELVRLDGLGARMPAELSGGQRQRAALARALVIRPAVLLLDEPLSNLDLKLRETLREEIVRVQKSLGVTTIFVTHDQSEALAMSDRVVVMREGEIRQIGVPEDIYHRPVDRYVGSFVGQMNFAPRPGGGSLGFRPEDAVVRAAPADGALCLPGRLERAVFLGARRDWRVRLDGGALAIAASAEGDLAAGAAVHLCVDNARTHVFEEDPDVYRE